MSSVGSHAPQHRMFYMQLLTLRSRPKCSAEALSFLQCCHVHPAVILQEHLTLRYPWLSEEERLSNDTRML